MGVGVLDAAGVGPAPGRNTIQAGTMSDVLSILQEVSVWPLALLGGVAFFLGLLVGRIGKTSPANRRSITTEAGTFVDLDVYRESQKTNARLEQENQVFSEFFQILTDFTKEMDGRLDRSLLPRRLLEIVDKIFLPNQILIFLTDRKNPGSLILKETKGITKSPNQSREIRVGEGKVGWVAQQRMVMDQEDFVREMRTGGGAVLDAPAHFRFKVDLCAPMLAYNGAVQGVISVGGITRHPKFEKRLLVTIGDLGGIALLNHALMEDQKKKANSDGLTGLINKRYLKELLGGEIHKAETQHRPVSLFIFDLDHFKKLNDNYGHLTGDRVLQGTADVLRKTVRDTDFAARWGGEEFLVILPDTPKDGALKAAEKVREALESQVFQDDEGNPIRKVTLSGGIATFPEDGRQQMELVGAADEALYRAKEMGRNRVVRSEPKFLSDHSDEPEIGGGAVA
ncbi:MAG TPA: sensor domain-containing diguanylate cyclase [Candidatus Polarisedimenticolia bacterium]|jgi:diguanylate cyclase (GGDEF)-like protein|nr:sensor domain-containing diguanylate cyclase [Candidatus Polarisedimenticolia bacterium]